MTNADDVELPGSAGPPADLLIGNPEREAAQDALETHLIDGRLDAAEHERRSQACELARTQAELRQIFADLPAPHPALPSNAVPPAARDDDDSIPPVAVAGCLVLGLGIPVAIVCGVVYGAWWALAVPVAVPAAMAYIEQLRTRPSGTTERAGGDL